ncbi:hypothetical protein GGR25_004565 [Kaistia hirudinis]|uniref:Uncharacterized protein n=1 Tax=Kaistia hirudinis TaxID=1293440 RepID=A0A840AUY6_9HYPH|nr:hypothetical protein [Kaistia hirudinis]MBB3933492.1 hypothetical protein [Kaistia hirudinis]
MANKVADVTLSFRVKQHALDLNDQDKEQYAIIGYFVSRFSSLDYHLDTLIFTFAEIYPVITRSISKHYPVDYRSKIDFLIDCITAKAFLRECGDAEGMFDLNILAFGLEEIFSFRNILIHSKIIMTERKQDKLVFQVRKYSRLQYQTGAFSVEEYRYSGGYVSYLLDQIEYHESTLIRLTELLHGVDVAKERDALLRGRSRIKEIAQNLSIGV